MMIKKKLIIQHHVDQAEAQRFRDTPARPPEKRTCAGYREQNLKQAFVKLIGRYHQPDGLAAQPGWRVGGGSAGNGDTDTT